MTPVAQQHATHIDVDAVERAWHHAWAHPFFADPDAWIASQHPTFMQRCFSNGGKVLFCIDEGIEPAEGESGIYLAGSGILYKKNTLPDAASRRKQLAEDLRGKNITAVTSHADCGACGLFCREAGLDVPEDVAREWGEALAQELGVPYVGHMHPQRPHFHNAIIAYYDGTGTFSQPARAGLPAGFTVSRGSIPDAEHAAWELALAAKIATGDHGFGSRFTHERPFHIVVIADSAQIDGLVQEAAAALAGMPVKMVVMRAV